MLEDVKGRYSRIEISLDEAIEDKELSLTGDYLSIISISGAGTCQIKLDHRHSQNIDLREITGLTGVFERLFFTTDGSGGKCIMFVGAGMAVTISPDPQKLRNFGAAGTSGITSNTAVTCLAAETFKLTDVSISNSNAKYSCYVGAWHYDPATFKAHAYILHPHHKIYFSAIDMYSLGVISYDGVHNVYVDILGSYE